MLRSPSESCTPFLSLQFCFNTTRHIFNQFVANPFSISRQSFALIDSGNPVRLAVSGYRRYRSRCRSAQTCSIGLRSGESGGHSITFALTYQEQGKLTEAGKMYEEVLAKRRVILGDEHPFTFTSMETLATMYWQQGRNEAAKVGRGSVGEV